MKIGWQLTKLLQKLGGLRFLAHIAYRLVLDLPTPEGQETELT